MSVESDADLIGLRRAGAVVRATINAMIAALEPGITTRDLDAIAGGVIARAGARSAPKLVYAFPGEPLIAAGTGRMVTLRDGWTLRTRDRARSAHHEHTVMVTATGARLLTA